MEIGNLVNVVRVAVAVVAARLTVVRAAPNLALGAGVAVDAAVFVGQRLEVIALVIGGVSNFILTVIQAGCLSTYLLSANTGILIYRIVLGVIKYQRSSEHPEYTDLVDEQSASLGAVDKTGHGGPVEAQCASELGDRQLPVTEDPDHPQLGEGEVVLGRHPRQCRHDGERNRTERLDEFGTCALPTA